MSTESVLTAQKLVEVLNSLLPSEFEALIFEIDAPQQYLPSGDAPTMTRAIALARWADANGRTSDVQLALLRLRPKSELRIVTVAVDSTLETPSREALAPIVSTSELVKELEELLVRRPHVQADEQKMSVALAQIDGLVRQIMERGRVKEGDVVANTRLIKPIGHGSFGTVWLAKRTDGGALAATKVFHLDKLADGMMLWRFRRSIRALQHLNSDRSTPSGIARIIAPSDDMLSFSMEFYSDGNLDKISERGWTLEKKIDVFKEVCRAVDFAHQRGIIHRDIKPANIVLDSQQRPILTDFDIADIKFATRISTPQGGLGTHVFAAPEQLEEGDQATERSDVYGLGRLLYYLLLERSPGHEIEADPSLERLAAYPAAIVAIVRRATQYDPIRRYPSVNAMLYDLEAYRSRWAALQARLNAGLRWARYNAAFLLTCAIIIFGTTAFGIYNRAQVKLLREAELRISQENSSLKEQTAKLEGNSEQMKQMKQALIIRLKECQDFVQKLNSTKDKKSDTVQDPPPTQH